DMYFCVFGKFERFAPEECCTMVSTSRVMAAITVAAVLLIPSIGSTQPPAGESPALVVDSQNREEGIEGIVKHLKEAYVYPETAEKIEADLRKRLKNKEYDGISSGQVLAKTLTEHLRAVSNDKHLRVIYRQDSLAGPSRVGRQTPERMR